MQGNFIKMAEDSIISIDVERILKQKAGKKYKYIPGFLVSYLKRIVHQDELNVFLQSSKDKVGVEFLVTLVDENGEMSEYVQVETPSYDSFTMDFDESLNGDDDTM